MGPYSEGKLLSGHEASMVMGPGTAGGSFEGQHVCRSYPAARYSCARRTAAAPSPTAEATRFIEP